MNSSTESNAPAAEATASGGGTNFSFVRPLFFGLLAVGALAWCVRAAVHLYRYEETDDAYLTGHLHQVSAQVEGQVKEVLVQENQTVRAGEVLLRLDPLEYKIALAKAEAALAQAKALEAQSLAAANQAEASLAESKARTAQAEAQVAQSDSQSGLAEITLTRSEQLFSRGAAATQADVDAARSAFRVAQAAGHAARANLVAARAGFDSASAAQAAVRAQADAARANAAVAESQRQEAARKLSLTDIVAPAAGRIGNRRVEAGNHVQAGQALLALAEPEPWIIANFKETQITRMQSGQPVEISIDALPDLSLHGQLDSVSPASGAQFALLPPDNSTGNFNKVVQRVPVKINLDASSRQQLGDRLRLGLSAVVNVRVR